MDTWILSHHVSAYPIHVSSSFDTFQGYCCEVEGYSAVTLTLIVSGEPQGRHLLYFFLPVYQDYTRSAPPDVILVKLLGIHSLLLNSIYNYKLAYLFGTYTPATGSPNERLSSEVIFLLGKESVLRCFCAHSCCQQIYLFRQKPAKS